MFYKILSSFFVLIFALSGTSIPTTKTLSPPAQNIGPNLIINGDFESGNTGFSTEYAFAPGNILNPATYDVLSNPNSAHPSAASFGDHTSGSGLMMAINGADVPGPVVWSQAVPVTANTDYEFSAWITSWFLISPSQLEFRINGSPIGTFTTTRASGLWEQFAVGWNSGNSTSALIEIVNSSTSYSGNDLAIDDLSLESLPCATNLLINSNFESGNTGFSSGYSFVAGNVTLGGTYDVVSNPNSAHPSAAPFGDHTSGSGLMMAINGATSSGRVVWSQTVPVVTNTDYEFSAWVASWFFVSPAQLEVRINGTPVGTHTAPPTQGSWQQFTAAWNSGASTSAAIEIVDLNTADNGNDFALDDLAFRSLGACETPTSTPVNTPTGTLTPPTPTNTPTGTVPACTEGLGPNLIVNGNFEAGNTGFTSAYIFTPGNIMNLNTYDVLTDPINGHPAATSYGDHTTGAGNMLAFNGSTTAGQVVWSQTVIVKANTPYKFSAWVSSWTPTFPGQLQFTVNGVSVGTFTASSTTGVWQAFTANWNSGTSTSAAIQIVDASLQPSGNDPALDDVALAEFIKCGTPTATSTPTNTPIGTPNTPTGIPTNTSQLGQLKLCKDSIRGVPDGTIFVIRVNSVSYDVPSGYCVLAGTYPLNTNVTIRETIPAGYSVVSIRVLPSGRLVSRDISIGRVVVEIGTGVTEVLYKNQVVSPATPTKTDTPRPTRTPSPTPSCSPNCTPTPTPPPTGRLQICKEADGAGVTGNFVFRYDSKSRTLPVGACSLIFSTEAGTLTITEDARAGFAVSDIYTIPANRLVSKNINNRTATVTIVQGNASTQTIIVFVNREVTTNSP